MPVVILILILIIILNTLYVKYYKTIRNFKIRKEIKNKGDKYYRYIDTNYSPSIVSYLINQKIEAKKDLVADIFNLYAKKIIDIRKKNEKEYEIFINSDNEDKINFLYENDIYIIDTIFLNKEEFEYEKWIKKIISVYRNNLNVNNKKTDFNKQLLRKTYLLGSIYLGLLIINLIFFKGNLVNFIIITGVIFCLVYILLFSNNAKVRDENIDMHLSKEARKELEKWIKLENFIKDYTLLNEKGYEEIAIFEQYIPFAMVLDVNHKYYREIRKILQKEKYREFINAAKKYNNISSIFNQYF